MRLAHRPYYPNVNDIWHFFDLMFNDDEARLSLSEKVKNDDRVTELTFELPGVAKSDVNVEFNDDLLTVTAKLRGAVRTWTSMIDKDEHDVSATTATLELGILTVKVPKTQRKQKAKIVIDVV